jgi:TolB-like protein/Flp pilus assembly protein TadD
VVVLPLDNVRQDEAQDYFVQGMHDALIVELTKIDALNVISRTSSLKYRDTQLSLPEIARELSVDMVIEGSVLHAGDKVRISTQLIEGESDRHLWGGSFDRQVTDILSLYSDVARQIARQVEVEVTPADLERLAEARQVNPEAYVKYLEARYLLDTWSPQEMLRGIELMREAVNMDPASATMHAGLATGLQYIAWFNFIEPLLVVGEARRSADRALALDPESADAWTAQGAVSYYLEFDIPGAVQALENALDLHPGNQQALIHYAWLLGEAGHFEKAIPLAQRSIELDPFSAVARGSLAQIHYLSRNFEKSLDLYQEALELDRQDPSAYYFLTWPLVQLENFEKAVEHARISVELSDGAHLYRMGLAYSLARSGEEDEARDILAALEREGAQPVFLAEIHAGLGNIEEAIEQLELAYKARNSTILYIRKSPQFDPLRGRPRFEALIERIGWSDQAFD